VNGPEVITWNEYFKRFNDSLGLPPLKRIKTARTNLRTKTIEPLRRLARYVQANYMEVVKKIAENSNLAKKVIRKTEAAIRKTPAPDELRLFSRNAVYKITKAEELIGYYPKIDINTGLNTTIAWVEHHGFLLRSQL
jgi:hypothetical protein